MPFLILLARGLCIRLHSAKAAVSCSDTLASSIERHGGAFQWAHRIGRWEARRYIIGDSIEIGFAIGFIRRVNSFV